MERTLTSYPVPYLAMENNDCAVETAIETLKTKLDKAPGAVLNDVMRRCDPGTHGALIDWIADRSSEATARRLPREWSPTKNRRLWLLYTAADLSCPVQPPFR